MIIKIKYYAKIVYWFWSFLNFLKLSNILIQNASIPNIIFVINIKANLNLIKLEYTFIKK